MTLDPVILFFALGVFARLARSELRLPDALYETLSIYLLIAIGLKGGAQIAVQPLAQLWPVALAAVALSAAVPLVLYPVLRAGVRLGAADAASIAAHYGSVSVVTFAVAQSALSRAGIEPEAFLAMLVALMEAPGIVVGVLLARRGMAREAGPGAAAASSWGTLLHEVLFGKAVVLLLGGIAIGWIAGPRALEPIDPVFVGLFKGVLALFLLELGLVAGGRLQDLRRAGPRLLAFGLIAPPLLALVGGAIGLALGLSVAGVATLATLAASASYIAAPTAMRIAVPQANPSLSIGLALGVTFPFNVLIGIPLYIELARRAAG
ncbi:MAG: sodium-dependent bicarbonate transport family permease [Burkholderiales bacterium]|nr:MAG: sodium-dependent bicarbonate transport family permease [Burkholderiales bacterium]